MFSMYFFGTNLQKGVKMKYHDHRDSQRVKYVSKAGFKLL